MSEAPSRSQPKEAGRLSTGEKADQAREKVVKVNRVTKVVKGGRILSFSALVVVADDDGRVGVGKGKAREVAGAVQKAVVHARRNLLPLPLNKGTVYHKVTGRYGASTVLLMPASEGKGIIAGGPVRSFLSMTRVRDISAKIVGSANPHNVLRALKDAISQLRSPEHVAAKRGKTLSEILPARAQRGGEV